MAWEGVKDRILDCVGVDVGLDNLNLFRGQVVLREKWPQGLKVLRLEGVFFMREPELWVPIEWYGWKGQRALASYCLQRRPKLCSIGSVMVSVRRCADKALWCQSVSILRGSVLDDLHSPQIVLGRFWGQDGSSVGQD